MNQPFIILVDDDEDDSSFIVNAFRKQVPEATISHFESGHQALSYIKANVDLMIASLVVTDWNMPSMTGPELILLIRAIPQYWHTPIIVLSTASIEVGIDLAIQAGADMYIEKPSSVAAFELIIQDLAEQYL